MRPPHCLLPSLPSFDLNDVTAASCCVLMNRKPFNVAVRREYLKLYIFKGQSLDEAFRFLFPFPIPFLVPPSLPRPFPFVFVLPAPGTSILTITFLVIIISGCFSPSSVWLERLKKLTASWSSSPGGTLRNVQGFSRIGVSLCFGLFSPLERHSPLLDLL